MPPKERNLLLPASLELPILLQPSPHISTYYHLYLSLSQDTVWEVTCSNGHIISHLEK